MGDVDYFPIEVLRGALVGKRWPGKKKLVVANVIMGPAGPAAILGAGRNTRTLMISDQVLYYMAPELRKRLEDARAAAGEVFQPPPPPPPSFAPPDVPTPGVFMPPPMSPLPEVPPPEAPPPLPIMYRPPEGRSYIPGTEPIDKIPASPPTKVAALGPMPPWLLPVAAGVGVLGLLLMLRR